MKKAFTMVELIFVILVIGILAAIAMNKVAASRDDAKVTKAIINLKNCIADIKSSYTATQSETSKVGDADGSKGFDTCKAVKEDACFAIAGVENGANSDGNITVGAGINAAQWCPLAKDSAEKKGLFDKTGAKEFSFGGAHIIAD